jgi:hypothetical protein
VWEYWKSSWVVLGPVFALITFYSSFTPTISITPGPSLDKTQTYSTQILITNIGRVPIYDLSFGCGFGSGPGTMRVVNLEGLGNDLAPVQKLAPGQPTTRSCAVASNVQGSNSLTFTVRFKWPLVGWLSGWQDSKSVRFDVKEGRDGKFLVPSTAP